MAKRKDTGIFQRGSTWHIRFTVNGMQKRESTHSNKREDARLLLGKRLTEIAEGKEPEIKKIKNHTFEELSIEYYKWSQMQRSFNSKRIFIKQLVEVFGHLQLRQLSTRIVEQFQTDRLSKGNKPATANRLLATLKHSIHKGYQWEMLSEETLKRVRQVKFLEENNKRLRYLSIEECNSLINACDDHLKPIVVTALNTGMRRGEILNLKWEQVDLKHGFILLAITKNGDRREIPINRTMQALFLDKNLIRRLDVPFVFYDSIRGKPYLDVKRSFHTALRRAKINDFHFHDLRHTFASHLVMAGIDLTSVSKLLGHKTLTMTLRYAHLAPDHLSNAVNVLDSTFKSTISTKLAQVNG